MKRQSFWHWLKAEIMWSETFYKSVKNLGVVLDECLQWNFDINQLCLKLNKAMVSKICHYVDETTLRPLYYAISQPHLSYVCTAWGLNIKYDWISISQRKAMRIIFSLILMNTLLPCSQKQKSWNLLTLAKWKTALLLINL